jgi:acetyltransferase-like isoleucine patch superfamily enzyme
MVQHTNIKADNTDVLAEERVSGAEIVQHDNLRPQCYCEDPLSLFPWALTQLYSWWVSLVYPFASKGRNLDVHFMSQLTRKRASRISLGNSVSLKKGAWLNVATADTEGEPIIVIEDNCNIGADSIISGKNRIHLEPYVLVAQSVLIVDHNHAYEDITRPIVNQGITEGGRIRIGWGSWIAHGAAILCPKGELTIGRNCVIAANSVVTRSIPDYSLVAGLPARIIRQYDPETKTWRMGRTRA